MEKKLESKTIFEGRVVHLTLDQVECENGAVSTREVIHHHGGVGIMAIKDHKILLAKQYRYATGTYTLEIPAGKLEKDEDPKECAFRELEEETNHRAKNMELVLKFFPTPGYTSEIIWIYKAIDFKLVDDALAADEDEDIEAIWLDLDKAKQMIYTGEIMDAKTILSIMNALDNNL